MQQPESVTRQAAKTAARQMKVQQLPPLTLSRWTTYMIFQRRVILAIDREEPDSREALARISGLGPAKIDRFGDDILELVRAQRRRHPTNGAD